MQLVIFIGIQATGKSTFYKESIFRTHLRINLVMLRTRRREERIFDACIASRTKLVIDNTNPLKTDRARYIDKAKKAKYEIIGYFFCSDIEESLKRNSRRSVGEVIPGYAVRSTHDKLEMPSFEEGFDKLYHVKIADHNEFKIDDWKDEFFLS